MVISEIIKIIASFVSVIPVIGILALVIVVFFSVNRIVETLTFSRINLLLLLLRVFPFIGKTMRKKFCNTLKSEDFTNWETAVLRKIYSGFPLTEYLGGEFPVVCFYPSSKLDCNYPFASLSDAKKVYPIPEPNGNLFSKNKYRKIKYKLIVGDRIRRPKVPGFMLQHFHLDQNNTIAGYCASVGTFEQCIYSSNILEYELYLAYRKKRNIREESAKKILKRLPLRNYIHSNMSPLYVLTTGANRASLLSIQMLVIFFDAKDKEYKAIYIKRSDDVATKPGYYQFIPSGGFEIYSKNDVFDEFTIKEQFSVTLALFREFAEEVFSAKEFDWGTGKPFQDIHNHEKVQYITEKIKKRKAQMEFIGSVVDLVTLRHELSFVLKIDDALFSTFRFEYNHEGAELHVNSISEIENMLKSNDGEKLRLLCPDSAGLMRLASRSNLYKQACENLEEKAN